LIPSPYTEFQEWPEWWLSEFPAYDCNVESLEYIRNRHLPKAVADHFGLRWDDHRRMVVCPFYTVSGKFAGARGRAIDSNCDKRFRHHDYAWNGVRNSSMIW